MGKKELTRDERVQLLFEALQIKKAEVANAERPQYITGGLFRYSESNGSSIDIISERNEKKLIEILTFLLERSEKHQKAAELLHLNSNFTWLGFTVDEWFTDLETRVSILQIAKKRTELKELEEKINKVVSPELRLEMEMKALEDTLLK